MRNVYRDGSNFVTVRVCQYLYYVRFPYNFLHFLRNMLKITPVVVINKQTSKDEQQTGDIFPVTSLGYQAKMTIFPKNKCCCSFQKATKILFVVLLLLPDKKKKKLSAALNPFKCNPICHRGHKTFSSGAILERLWNSIRSPCGDNSDAKGLSKILNNWDRIT